ncbi:MAG: hypothetical protein V1647_06315 [Pseudomonadota bacterium]
MSITTYITIVLSAFSIIQALLLLKQGKTFSCYKYMFYSLLFMLLNLAVLEQHFQIYLVCVLFLKILFTSQDDEIKNPFIYISNTIIVALTASNIYAHGGEIPVICKILYIGLIPLLIRAIVDKSVVSPLYITQALLLASIVHTPLSTGAVLLYMVMTFFFSSGIVLIFLTLAVFIDGNIFQEIILKMDAGRQYNILLSVLFSLAAARLIENVYDRALIKFNTKTIIPIILGIAAIFAPALINSSFKTSLPIPLSACIVFIVTDFKYLNIFSKIRVYRSWDIAASVFIKAVENTSTNTKAVKELTISFLLTTVERTKGFTLALISSIRLISKRLFTQCKDLFTSTLSRSAGGIEDAILKTGYKEGLALISLFILIIIILSGVFL